ncbi:MAG: cytochrome P450 [Porticoccaceae bacterium]
MTKMNEAFVALSKAYAGTMADPYPRYKELREQSVVYQGDLVSELGVPSLVAGRTGDRKVFTFLGHEICSRALLDPATYSSVIYKEAFGGVMGDPVILYQEGDEHRAHRSILASILSPAAIRQMSDAHFKPTIQAMVRDIADRGEGELMADLILDFPLRVIYKLFGLPNDDPEAMDLFNTRALVMVLGGMCDFSKPEEAQQRIANAFKASGEIYNQILDVVRTRRAAGDTDGNDLIAQLIRLDNGGKKLADEEIAQVLRPTMAAAGETTSRAFANVLSLLLERPHLLEQVRNDRSLVKPAIDEAMRYEGSVSIIPRITIQDAEVAGVHIPAGSGVSMLVGAANRDPAVHEEPDVYDFRKKRIKQAMSFGFGHHMCMGMPLAKIEMDIALNAVLDYLPNLRLDPQGGYEGIRGIQFRSPTAIPVVWDAG